MKIDFLVGNLCKLMDLYLFCATKNVIIIIIIIILRVLNIVLDNYFLGCFIFGEISALTIVMRF